MKTSIFDMTFTLPPLIEMTEVEMGMHWPYSYALAGPFACHENIYL